MNNIIPLPFHSPSSVYQEHNFLYVGFPMDIVKLPLHDNIFIFLGHIFIFSSLFFLIFFFSFFSGILGGNSFFGQSFSLFDSIKN